MRIQSVPSIVEELKKFPFYISVKLDGQSGTFIKHEGELIVCSRNLQLKPGNNQWWEVAEKYDLANKLPEGFAIQGEVCGPGIQGNKMRFHEVDLFVFNVFNVTDRKYLDFSEFTGFCETHGLKTVPIEKLCATQGVRESFDYSVENFLAMAEGKYDCGSEREGIVIRTVTEERSDALGGDRFSFKAISNKFLLKNKE